MRGVFVLHDPGRSKIYCDVRSFRPRVGGVYPQVVVPQCWEEQVVIEALRRKPNTLIDPPEKGVGVRNGTGIL